MFKFKSYNVKKVSEKNKKEQPKSSFSTGTLKKLPSSSNGTKSSSSASSSSSSSSKTKKKPHHKKSKLQITNNHQNIQKKSIQKRL